MHDKFILIGVPIVAIAIGVLVLLFSIEAPSQIHLPAGSIQPAAVVVPFTTILQGKQSAVQKRVNYSITSADEFSGLWKLVNATGTPPTIDFKTHQVLAVFAGDESSTSISIAKIEDATERLVSITVVELDGACASKVAVTSPYEIISVPMTSLPLAHKDILATTTCAKQ